MAVLVEIHLADFDDEPSGASVKIWNNADSTPADVVAQFEEVYTGMTAVLDRLDAAEAASGSTPAADPAPASA